MLANMNFLVDGQFVLSSFIDLALAEELALSSGTGDEEFVFRVSGRPYHNEFTADRVVLIAGDSSSLSVKTFKLEGRPVVCGCTWEGNPLVKMAITKEDRQPLLALLNHLRGEDNSESLDIDPIPKGEILTGKALKELKESIEGLSDD